MFFVILFADFLNRQVNIDTSVIVTGTNTIAVLTNNMDQWAFFDLQLTASVSGGLGMSLYSFPLLPFFSSSAPYPISKVLQLYTNWTFRCYSPNCCSNLCSHLRSHIRSYLCPYQGTWKWLEVWTLFILSYFIYFVFILLIFYISCGIKGQMIGGSCVCDNGWGGSDCNTNLCSYTGTFSPLPHPFSSLFFINFYSLGATKVNVIPQGSSFRNIQSSTVSSTPAGWFGTTFDDSWWYVLRVWVSGVKGERMWMGVSKCEVGRECGRILNCVAGNYNQRPSQPLATPPRPLPSMLIAICTARYTSAFFSSHFIPSSNLFIPEILDWCALRRRLAERNAVHLIGGCSSNLDQRKVRRYPCLPLCSSRLLVLVSFWLFSSQMLPHHLTPSLVLPPLPSFIFSLIHVRKWNSVLTIDGSMFGDVNVIAVEVRYPTLSLSSSSPFSNFHVLFLSFLFYFYPFVFNSSFLGAIGWWALVKLLRHAIGCYVQCQDLHSPRLIPLLTSCCIISL